MKSRRWRRAARSEYGEEGDNRRVHERSLVGRMGKRGWGGLGPGGGVSSGCGMEA